MSKKNREIAFDIVNYTLLTLIAAIMLYPFLNVIAVAFSDYSAYLENPLMIWPRRINLAAFEHVFKDPLILSSYKNTIIITIAGTLISLLLTIMTAYPLSRKDLKGKPILMNIIIFTMLFSGGLIPNYYLIRSLHMIDTLWALILPGALGAYNIILMKNFFESIPDSLEEAAKIDGASDVYILFKIIVPLSTPIIATIALFVAVGYWNSFFSAIVYIRDPGKWTLQLVLREIIMAANTQLLQTGGNYAEMTNIPPQTLKYATLIVAVVPILCVYPFLQKYFVKGIMLGAVKG
ncbi:carbohydrate ABC transporter permease [Mahella australiensis]|uniref:Binding-protein-dependent transport systems inner membrane component n=1 Tax=Mahella australiensis (strain DSM 15567 / CIP 107919 / 50-1 BON) TaxID=697281 RepID=F4A121_MAHA5|nr:carbohydrate ABC transporter permease [Mahella australiensis]AEE95924.1 binding-protein-dependent transport systems inner membrane component [Mahella australiensis 50-1 BON]